MTSNLTWTNEKRKLRDLVPWPRNPRQIKVKEAERLAQSLDEFAQVETIAIGPQGEVYNGHQRLNVWRDSYGSDLEIDVRVASRPLTEKEREKLTVYLHKGAAGEWDFDTLSEWDIGDLQEWGFQEWELGIVADNDPEAEWKGMPEFENEPKAHRTLSIHFASADDVKTFADLIEQTITDKTRSLWYPQRSRDDLKSFGYVTAT